MAYPRTATVLAAALLTALSVSTPAGATGQAPRILHLGLVTEQDVPALPGSEPDTVVEPDVAVSPLDPDVAVAVAHDGRYPDAGAVAISYAWTHDGGRTWHHAPLPGLTRTTGGVWDRVSDPVPAFGPDGTAYVSTLLLSFGCASAVGVSRSTDGGRTFGAPVLAHRSDDCAYADDKNWLVVDNNRHSPHRGRLYQFWTPFFSDASGTETGSAQVVRWSDDRGMHWSATVNVSDTDGFTQGSQPMIQPDGTVIDEYVDFGDEAGEEGPERPGSDARAGEEEEDGLLLVARVSRDGGRTWSREYRIADDVSEGPEGVRCCVPSATVDPVTGRLYATWASTTPEKVALSTSTDGRHWSRPIQVNRDAREGLDHVNVDVSAYGGRVFVSYGTRDTTVAAGRFLQQQLSTSVDGGRHFGREIAVGPLSDLRYAAVAGGIFLGDYIGSAATRDRLYLVWCRSSRPADPAATFHQVVLGATLRP
jgi:hypothetical protein